jgi:hypothetical protein
MKEINCGFLQVDDTHLNLQHVIRIGSVRDGGYFVTKRLVESSDFLISGGISYNVAFEKDFWDINRTAKLIMIDGSFNIFTYLARPFYWMLFKRSFTMKIGGLVDMLYLKKKAVFLKKYLGPDFSMKQIFDKHIKQESSGYLKLDIEGAEYALLDDILEFRGQLTGFAIEFHDVPDHIPAINEFIAKLQMRMIGFNINETGGLNAANIPNVIELCFAAEQYAHATAIDVKVGKKFSNEAVNDLLIPVF